VQFELYIIGRTDDLESPALSLEDDSADAQAMEKASKNLKQTLSPAAFLPGATGSRKAKYPSSSSSSSSDRFRIFSHCDYV
jgi:hypothetical protein